MSSSIGVSFYDQNMNEIEINQLKAPIDLVIKRDPKMVDNEFQHINISQFHLVQNAFYLTANNASLHIELKPLNLKIGYLLVMKLGHLPILNTTFADFTSFELFCPSKSI